MTQHWLIDVEIPNINSLPEDSYHTTWVVRHADADAPDFASMRIWISSFFNGLDGGQLDAISEYMSGVCSRALNACTMSWYDINGHLDGSDHGSPVEVQTWTLGPGEGTNTLPAEVAAVVTLYGFNRNISPVESDTGTRPKSRKTGRIYVGPLSSLAMGIIGNQPRLTNNFVNDLAIAAERTRAGLKTVSSHAWGVWSRAGQDIEEVVGGHVDNAPDIQRRRGVASSNRVLW